MLKSMSLKQFLFTMERYAIKDNIEDGIFIKSFLELIEEEKSLVSSYFD